MNKVFGFLLVLLFVLVAPAQALLKGGTWQELRSSTDAINGSAPLADGGNIPVYQGSTLLTPGETHEVEFTAMPRDFSVNADPSAIQVVNPSDTEGDLFANPPKVQWENYQPPAVGLVWADAAAPDTPLSPQPLINQSFCAQNLAGRHLVVWPQESDATAIPALQLLTMTGVPNISTIPLLNAKVAIDIKPAASAPILVSADRVDEAQKASKAKVGESITLSITTHGCDGNAIGNAHFVIRRDDAINRKGDVNNSHPVRVSDTELTSTTTLYRGVTDAQGNATVVVAQPDGPGVKTHLVVSSESFPDLSSSVDVIFTTLTSPDSELATMYGHMQESATATVNGITYTFTRPKLAAETSGTSGSVVDNNETWSQFTWSGADNHCDVLPNAEQLVAMRNAHGTSETYTGWPVQSSVEYWSSTKTQTNSHYAVNMNTASVETEADSSRFLVSCVDKVPPAVHPQISLSPQGPYKTEVGDSIDLIMTVVDKDTQKPLPYRYVELSLDPATNRKGTHNDEWDSQRVAIKSGDISASSSAFYTGVTDVNGQAHLTLKHDDGMGVETPIRIVAEDDEGTKVELPFSVIFTVETSPDVDGANMWGHMRGVVDAGNLYKRPLLAVEASDSDGAPQTENNEQWASFNTVEAATRQCGTGQVPGTSSLTHLYGENPSNQMETDHGWPTKLHSYLSADGSDTSSVNVSLENGDIGSGSSNYLTCSANEMVAILDVYFNDDTGMRNAVAKVGEQIKMTVVSKNALNSQLIPNTDFTVTLAPGKQRDGLTTGFTDPSNGQLLFDDVAYSATQAPVYHGITDASGKAEIILTQPQGVGIMTPLSVAPVESLINTPTSRSVKFTVATSPDTPKANMWGHMADTITVGDQTFERPKLADEVSPARTQVEANETWARVLHPDAAGNPDAGGCAANRLPRIDQLEALYDDNSGGAINKTYGWPTLINYWTSTLQSASTWKLIALSNGSEFTGGNSSVYVSCLTSDNPVAASITIEPVDTSLWYDGNDLHAVKVKKGDTLQLKVTVKDANGNPISQAPFVLNRGDGYTRQNEKHTATQSGDPANIVTPVVIDGESLNYSGTKMGAMTGADGSKIISITRPNTNGTRTAIVATLYENASVNASIDTIFSVVTSPDVTVAKMWGHMPDTLKGNDGTVYHRPLLVDELQSKTNTVQYDEDHESWATFYGPESGKTNGNSCARGYYPSLTALDSLYATYPGRSIKNMQGWPVSRSYWTGSLGSTGNPISVSKATMYYIVDLSDDSRRLITNTSASDTQYQICSADSSVQATQIKITSSLATNADAQAIKVASSEAVPTVITTLDAQGNPVGNVPFMLTRDAGTARNTSYKPEKSSVLNLYSGGIAVDWTWSKSPGYPYYGITGNDGTFVMDVTSAYAPGVKNTLTASLYQGVSASSSLPVIFTAITSPDSDKANMWGHMPETFTASNGAEFQRPRLRYEEGASSNTSYILANNEAWLSLKASFVMSQDAGACGLNQMPLLADLAALYGDHPNGSLETDLGMPLTTTSSTRWWSGDPLLVNQSINYQYYDMKSGGSGYNAGNENYLQICLTTARQTNIALSSTSWDESKSAFVAKKGEAMPVTVTVTDASGKAQANTVVLITRAFSYSRDNKSVSSSMNLTPVLPSGAVVALMSNGSKWYGMTGDDGTLQLTLNQDNSSGLKTAITVSQATDSLIKASNDVIFTVLTSPDSPYAVNWGHMPETVAGPENRLYQRPRLQAEAPSGVTYITWNGEKWALPTGDQTYTAGKSVCDVEYMPLMADLKALYQRYPEGELEKQFGWPVTSGRYWWSADLNTSKLHQGINLKTGQTSTPYSTPELQICLVNARDVPGSITLTSTAMDVGKDAAVAKKGEAIPLLVTVKDRSGKPMPNAPFTLSRADAKDRTSGTYTSNGADDLSLQALSPSASTTSMTTTGIVFSGVTGTDGTATFAVRQDASVGLNTALTASATDDVTNATNATLNVIFTVITSPDSSYAKYWGHMPDTLTVDGVTLHRPLLRSEAPGVTDTVVDNNETWATVYSKADGLYFDMSKNCGGVANFPEKSLLEKMRDEQIASTNGWPVTLRSYLSGTPAKYNYCRVSLLEGGDTECPTVNSDYKAGYAACIVQP
ncbi:TPA: hypothetical protein N3A33_001713 [Salmonella enterica subsp. salamae serovar 28:r:e,n,z15]|nr:hypothetical protein [Salmonella enterica subsp. salamae serovar 28:r:e,n,z15]